MCSYHTHKKGDCEVMHALTRLIVENISQCVSYIKSSKNQVVHFKYTQFLFVSYIPKS